MNLVYQDLACQLGTERVECWLMRPFAVLVALFGVSLATIAGCGIVFAQTDHSITIRMLDSKTGRPITTSEFQIWTDHATGTNRTWIRPDTDGVGEIILPRSASVIAVHAQYGKAMWFYGNCDAEKDHVNHWYAISEILTSGVVAPNRCGKQKAVAKPGEFIFFVRPMTFWDKLHE